MVESNLFIVSHFDFGGFYVFAQDFQKSVEATHKHELNIKEATRSCQ